MALPGLPEEKRMTELMSHRSNPPVGGHAAEPERVEYPQFLSLLASCLYHKRWFYYLDGPVDSA